MLKGHRTEVRLTPQKEQISQALYTVEVTRQILRETYKLTEKAIPRHRRSHTLASWWCAGDAGWLLWGTLVKPLRSTHLDA